MISFFPTILLFVVCFLRKKKCMYEGATGPPPEPQRFWMCLRTNFVTALCTCSKGKTSKQEPEECASPLVSIKLAMMAPYCGRIAVAQSSAPRSASSTTSGCWVSILDSCSDRGCTELWIAQTVVMRCSRQGLPRASTSTFSDFIFLSHSQILGRLLPLRDSKRLRTAAWSVLTAAAATNRNTCACPAKLRTAARTRPSQHDGGRPAWGGGGHLMASSSKKRERNF